MCQALCRVQWGQDCHQLLRGRHACSSWPYGRRVHHCSKGQAREGPNLLTQKFGEALLWWRRLWGWPKSGSLSTIYQRKEGRRLRAIGCPGTRFPLVLRDKDEIRGQAQDWCCSRAEPGSLRAADWRFLFLVAFSEHRSGMESLPVYAVGWIKANGHRTLTSWECKLLNVSRSALRSSKESCHRVSWLHVSSMGVVLAKVISFPCWSEKLSGEGQCSRVFCLRERGVCVCVCVCTGRRGLSWGMGRGIRFLAQKANIALL